MMHSPSAKRKSSSVALRPSGVRVLNPWRILGLGIVFGVGVGLVYLSWISLPASERSLPFSIPPRGVEDAKALGRYLGKYSEDYFLHVVFVYLVTYIFLQTFAIPGSIFLSIIAGALFNFPLALFLVCLSAAVGASNASLISAYIGKGLVEWAFPERIANWRLAVSKQDGNLLNYMIFLRITPIVPNWLINIASPMVGFPLKAFFWGTFLGVGVPSLFFVNMGRTLQQLTAEEASLPLSTLFWLFVFGLVSLVPVLGKNLPAVRRWFPE